MRLLQADRLPTKTNPMTLLNRPTSIVKVGSFWSEVKTRAFTERGDRPDLSGLWIRDYCEIIGDESRSSVTVSGCSQVGKSYFNFLNANYQASKGYRVLVILPTQESLFRNLKNQITPISSSWGILDPIGAQTWQGRGKGAIVFGYASTSGNSPNKSRSGLANTGGSGSAVSCDWLIIDEVSQIPADSLAPFERRLDAGVIESRPVRMLGTAGAGGGIERFSGDVPNVYPECVCPNCHKPFDLDPYKCLFSTVSSSGWVEKWTVDDRGEPCVNCPNCNSPIGDPLASTRITAPLDPAIVLHLTPLLRRGNPSNEIIRSMLSAQRNGGGAQDWLQQSLGVPSTLRGFMRLKPSDLQSIHTPIEPGSFQGLFCGFDQGIGNHYGCKIAVHLSPSGLPVIQVLAIEIGDSNMIRNLSMGCKGGLLDTMPDRTLALQLSEENSVIELARQKYNLGYICTENQVKIGDWSYPVIELPVTPHLVILEAALDQRLSFSCEITTIAKQHLTAVQFDRQQYKVIRPQDHNDDLYFALYFAVSAYLRSIT